MYFEWGLVGCDCVEVQQLKNIGGKKIVPLQVFIVVSLKLGTVYSREEDDFYTHITVFLQNVM